MAAAISIAGFGKLGHAIVNGAETRSRSGDAGSFLSPPFVKVLELCEGERMALALPTR